MWRTLLAEQIREAREAQNLTQNDVSAKLGLSIQSISSWENGKALPSFKNLEQLALLTNREMDFFFPCKQDTVTNTREPVKETEEAKLLSYFNVLNSEGKSHAMAILKSLTLNSDMLK